MKTIGWLGNFLKILLGHSVIWFVYYAWRIIEKIMGRTFGAVTKSHYYIMMTFRFMFKSLLVTIKYRNPVNPDCNIKLRVDLCQNNQQWYFRLKGKYELECMELIASGMASAEMFADIGANIGVFTVTIAQAFPTKEIIAVEPLKENFMSLNRNIALNSICNVEKHNAVVSNSRNEKIKFYPNPIHDGGGSAIKRAFYRTGDVYLDASQYQENNASFSPEIEIDSIKIDDIVNSKCVVKIDVEGAEVLVLESGRSAFSQGLVDLIVVEVLDDTIDRVIQILDEFGFDCFTQGVTEPIKTGARLSRYIGNIICLRRESSDYNFMKEQYFKLS
jgi:methyltransferase, FkbM family